MLFWIIRQFVCCTRQLSKLFGEKEHCHKKYVCVNNIPWLWVGAERSGQKYTVTELVNANIVYNLAIDAKYLTDVTKIYNVDRWLYLDPITLQELEFPLEGFVIENDSK